MKKIAILCVFAVAACGNPSEEIHTLKPKEFQEMAGSTPGAVILDVRTHDEIQNGYLKGALNFDFNAPEFTILMQGMDKATPYFVYCASGVRSGKAADKMKGLKFEHVYVMDGGMKAWTAEGLPVAMPAH